MWHQKKSSQIKLTFIINKATIVTAQQQPKPQQQNNQKL